NESIAAIVTAPVCKEQIVRFIPDFHGHTEYFADAFGATRYEMMFVAKKMKTIIVTRHIPLKDVPKALTIEKIHHSIMETHHALHTLFRVKKPKIAICGLNPHAGEGGTIGKEDLQFIVPAIDRARKTQIEVLGPFPADTLYVPQHAQKFDCIIAMYHDQGLTPIKALYFDELVNLTIGLPFIRTSPAHGTAFNIAGTGEAKPSSMKAAIKLACDLTQ
ncbi:MAG: 4-hydroxythreonine-4-phosphate dehydrogenase PdxA, partial [Candidatus Omnitrophica bacterium]|nr:4-hydroxythreonine-4-phosphate dehydrogenase PdxA [Candidatus Omnitrophota bacterium]